DNDVVTYELIKSRKCCCFSIYYVRSNKAIPVCIASGGRGCDDSQPAGKKLEEIK
ncbi:hypothetical protein XENOCAPTIV_005638, partial [Xenoophorus captivus]